MHIFCIFWQFFLHIYLHICPVSNNNHTQNSIKISEISTFWILLLFWQENDQRTSQTEMKEWQDKLRMWHKRDNWVPSVWNALSCCLPSLCSICVDWHWSHRLVCADLLWLSGHGSTVQITVCVKFSVLKLYVVWDKLYQWIVIVRVRSRAYFAF